MTSDGISRVTTLPVAIQIDMNEPLELRLSCDTTNLLR